MGSCLRRNDRKFFTTRNAALSNYQSRRPGERRDPYAAASLKAGYTTALLSIATEYGYEFLLAQERP
jgi:hypothetical protein